QPYTLLNRITHVLNADDERGLQLEGTWRQPGWGDLTLNRSHADGRLVANRPPRQFEERFAEIHAAPAGGSWLEATLFAGQSRKGLACTAGTCYVVEALEGMSLRVLARF